MKEMSVLVSIHKPHTDNIFDSYKRVEWRTQPMPEGKHYIYECKNGGGIGKVIGEYTVCQVRKFDRVCEIPHSVVESGYVPKTFLLEYSGGKKPLYAHKLISPKRYDKPRELSEFFIPCHDDVKCEDCCYWHYENTPNGITEFCMVHGNKPIKRPPQSWCYVEEVIK